MAKHLSERYGSLGAEKIAKQLSNYFSRSPLEFEQYCAMCEEIGSCVKQEFTSLRRIAFDLLDMNGDDSLCDFDVIEFD